MYVTTQRPTASAAVLLWAVLLLSQTFVNGYSLAKSRDVDDNGVAQTLYLSPSLAVDGWRHQVDTPARPANRTYAKNMTLCVPLILDDTFPFTNDFVPRLNAQTVMPSELVVAVSGIAQAAADKFAEDLSRMVKDIPVFVTSVEHNANPGENRNRCVSHSHGNIITFFDGDDYMHERRIEIINYVYNMFHPKVLLHTFLPTIFLKGEASPPIRDTFEVISAGTFRYKTPQETFSLGTLNGGSQTAQGWPTVSREVFTRMRYDERKAKGEDVEFLEDIMRRYGNGPRRKATLVLIDMPLGGYIPRLAKQKRMQWYHKKSFEYWGWGRADLQTSPASQFHFGGSRDIVPPRVQRHVSSIQSKSLTPAEVIQIQESALNPDMEPKALHLGGQTSERLSRAASQPPASQAGGVAEDGREQRWQRFASDLRARMHRPW